MKTGNQVNQDCRYFRGDRPCIPHKDTAVHCADCAEYDPIKTRILIIKLDAIGDVLRTAGIIPSLCSKYPEAHITWLTEAVAAPLLELVPGIDRIWAHDERLWERLLTEHFDFTFGLDCSRDSAALTFLSRADKKFGFSLDKAGRLVPLSESAERWFQMGLWDDLKRASRSTYQKILWDICELPMPTQPPTLALSESCNSAAEIFADQVGITNKDLVIGFVTGAGPRWPQKSLALVKQKELLWKLAEIYPDSAILLFGGPNEEKLNALLLREAALNVVNAGCHNSLTRFASLVNLVDVLITPDTLALHIALALRKQVVAYFGPTAPWEIDLFGMGKKIIAPVDCIACYRFDCPKSPKCTELISVDDILSAVNHSAKIYI